jgi:hypothetical protein
MKLLKIIKEIFKGKTATVTNDVPVETSDNNALLLQSEIAGLQLTIGGLQQELANQKALLAESEKSRQNMVNETLDAKLQTIFVGLASPLAQLALLYSLLKEGKEVKSENIFKLVSLVEATLEEAGLTRLHQVNDTLPFDPAAMGAVKPNLSFTSGEKIRVRLPGYSFKGKYICKSLVDKTES